MSEPYEAMVFSAYLPTRAITFIYQDGGPPFCGGIFRISYVRPATDADKKTYPDPPEGVCPCCGRPEDY